MQFFKERIENGRRIFFCQSLSSIYRVAPVRLARSEATLTLRPSEPATSFAKFSLVVCGCRTPRPSLILYGEFFPTLDKLAAAQARDLRHRDRLRSDRRDLVLRHAEIYAGRLSADPAGAVSRTIIHVSQLGMDCRYCHSFVDVAAHSNVPNTQTCMACHTQVQKDNPKLEPVRASWKRASRSSGCRFIARPITFFTITPRT